MLTFTLNNKPLLLDESTSVQMVWKNPACHIDEIPGDVGLGVSVKNNPHNVALLKHPNRFQKYADKKEREFEGFEIRYSGYRLLSGTYVVQESNNESSEGWLRSTVGNLGKQHREKYISDIPEFMLDREFVNKANYDPLTDPYTCPKIFNPEFFAEKSKKVQVTRKVPNPNYVPLSWWQDLWRNPKPYIDEQIEVEELTEAFRMASSHFVNWPNPDGTVATASSYADQGQVHIKPLEVYVVSPMLFVNYVLKKLFLDAGLVLNENFLETNEDLRKLILYNNFDITTIWFDTKEVSYAGNWQLGEIDYNKYWAEEVSIHHRDYSKPFQFKDLLPKIKLKDFLLSVQNLLNVCFHIRPDGKVDIIDRETILSDASIDISGYLRGEWEMKGAKETTLKFSFEHDENDLMFKKAWEDVDDLREKEGEPVSSWDVLIALATPELGELRYITETNQYARYDYIEAEEENPETGGANQTDTIGWIHVATGWQNGFYNRGQDEEEKVETKFSTLIGEQTTLTEQKGNIRNQRFAYENFSPRLLFYHGNNKATYETENISIDWEKKETGLLQTRWKNWGRFWVQREAVQRSADLPINMLDFILRNITKKFRSEEGEFIIEEVKTEFMLNSIGKTTITGYKINSAPKTITQNGRWVGPIEMLPGFGVTPL